MTEIDVGLPRYSCTRDARSLRPYN